MSEAQHRLALPRGTSIGDFEFHRVLGHGGFGLTYLGWNLSLDIPVAIKEYLPSDLAVREQDLSVAPKSSVDAADFQWGLDRFVEEARTLARFKHPNLIQVHQFFEAHGTAYIVMEYAEGETLSERLARQGTLSETELMGIVLPLLDGLEVVHEANVLHRDIKPGNIIIRDADGSPVLLDFGSARQAIGAKSRSVTSVVTPGYAPIEQYSTRGDQGAWTDLYALGGVCYRALTGRVPEDATERVLEDPLVPTGALCGERVSAGVAGAIDWALAVNKDDRPQSVGAWRDVLSGAVGAAAPVAASSAEPVGSPAPVASGLGRVFWVVLGLCLVGLVGLGGYWGLGELEEARQEQAAAAQVSSLLSAAARDLAAGRLTSPGGNNAWEKYQAVLGLVPGHGAAQAGLDQIIGRYGELFDAALASGDFGAASGYIARVRAVYPDASVLGGWQRRLSSAQALAAAQVAEAARQAEIEREQQAEAARARQEAARQEALERERKAEAARQAALERERKAAAARQAEIERQRKAEEAARERKAAAEKQRQAAARERQAAKVFSLPGGAEMAFVWIPPGVFQMGSPSGERGRDSDEGPLHEVEISRGFWLGTYEVTQGQWASVMGTRPWSGKSYVQENSSHPAVYISWNDVQRFIDKLNAASGSSVYRLPTEAEWEYACRAGRRTRWSFGDEESQLKHHAWYRANTWDAGKKYAQAVGRKSPNGWGLYDMHGNVWEWVQDWYGKDYYKSSPRVDPQGPTSGSDRVGRGGDFGDSARYVRSAYRLNASPGYRYGGIGVRLLRIDTP